MSENKTPNLNVLEEEFTTGKEAAANTPNEQVSK